MLLSTIALNIPSASAADYPTYLFLTAQPNPVGIGQEVSVVYWLDRAPPTASGPEETDGKAGKWKSLHQTVMWKQKIYQLQTQQAQD